MKDVRVVVTGMGAVSPLGNDVETLWQNAVAGKSGAAAITHFNPELFKTKFACEVKDFDPGKYLDRNEIKRSDRFVQLAIYAAAQAINDSGFEFEKMSPFDVGVIWGSGQGGMQTFEDEVGNFNRNDKNPHFNPFFVPKIIVNMASGMISMKYGYMGINYTTVSACATGNTAIMDAYNYIKMGKAKIFVTGGSEAGITEASIGGFTAMRAMSTRNDEPQKASRPYDANRDGFVMGEGAGALILEEYEHAKARGAKIYAEITGAAMTADAFHMTAPHPEGLGARGAMQFALDEAGIKINEVDYINPHGTSTPAGDLTELKAIRALLGEEKNNVHLSATKSMTGHLLGAAGAVEAILSIKAINDNIIPPTINVETPDPELPENINIVFNKAMEKEVKIAMSNTFGFGGHNGIVIFSEVE